MFGSALREIGYRRNDIQLQFLLEPYEEYTASPRTAREPPRVVEPLHY